MTREELKWKQRAEALYKIIDDIDTASETGDNDLYRRMVRKQVKKSQEIVAANGAGRVVWHDPDDDSASLG